MQKRKEIVRLMIARYAVQGFFMALLAFLAIRHQILKGGPSGTPALDAYCPLGGLVGLYEYVVGGGFIHRLNVSNFIMLAALVLLGLTVKSAFCGWICPFGTVQDWLGHLGRRLGLAADVAGTRLDSYGRYVKYVVLAVVIVLTAATGTLVFRDYDPFIAFLHMGFGELAWTAYAVLGLVVIGSLFIVRFWCRYFCPLAVFVGLVGKLGLLKVECDNENCVSCGQCEKLCPMDIPIAGQGRITSVECNSCLECLAAQDIKDAINLKPAWGGLRWRPVVVPLVTVVLLGGTVIGSQMMGLWRSKGGGGYGRGRLVAARMTSIPSVDDTTNEEDNNKEEEKKTEDRGGKNRSDPPRRGAEGGDSGRTDTEKESEGEPKGSERVIEVDGREVTVMGYMTLAEVEKSTSVPAAYLISNLGLPPGVPRNSRLGRLGRIYGFKLTDVRVHLRAYLDEKGKERKADEKKESKNKESS